jgi:hypothetical protein
MHLSRLAGRTMVAAALASAAGLAACDQDKLLTVPTPDVVQPKDISGPSALPSAFASAVGDFQVAYAGAYNTSDQTFLAYTEGQVLMSGLLTDELLNAETYTTRIEVDRRATNAVNSTMLVLFRDVQRARATADLVASRYAQFDPNNPNRAEVQALAAYTYLLLAENYCNGVPTSKVNDDGTFSYGEQQTGTQLLNSAVAKFDSAIVVATAAGGSGEAALNLARIGKGRALLDLSKPVEAAAAVADVASTFNYSIQHNENSGRQNNGVFSFNNVERRFTVGNNEGGNGLPFVTLNDPRVPVFEDPTGGFDGSTPLWLTYKFKDRSSPTPLAVGAEARLIEAEAALRAGNDGTFLAKLNEARASSLTYAEGSNPAPTAPEPLKLTDLPATAAGKQDLLFRERALDLYLTSHRLGDLRRLIWQYGRTAEQVFPTGPYQAANPRKSGTNYGTDVNFPIPFEESNNPQFNASCLNRSAGIV